MTHRLFITLTAAALSLSACGSSGIGSGDSGLFSQGGLRGSSQDVQGIRFRSRVRADGDDDRFFTVSTAGAGRAIGSAQEAGRTEATRYCLTRFGGSQIAWTVGPDVPAEQVSLTERGALVLTGQCLAR
ncbi:hypothetical protein JANAI62_33750 [Jannaschia pagri]|uniref:Lipoprotein n=1 Tax=Jannaschia pagri TaxID=2829797 RepID=A0ABQ4NQU1_9RHOB|nr:MULTISPECIES: hypothetical protein [unclassified Jannaschia]GIT92917.1 hypothetical protein JANAI61_33750 [Jannaschia sp. AI_61]GIT96752.1 hypothetical protein JANAI62_33750 [Jannaschia sp. AI_62]